MPTEPKKTPQRDDAEAQPESGYPDGRLTTKPSADPRDGDAKPRREDPTGSESEFDSGKPKS
jgi:hypothetical protein